MDYKLRHKGFIEMGREFGYPECCIASFLERTAIPVKVMIALNKSYERRKFHGTGYVPCHLCNETKTEEQMIETINKNRTVSKPFPKGD